MDNTRLKDLERFQKVIDNPKKHRLVRAAAYKAYKNIVTQMHDRKLTKLRAMLVKATIANDELAQWKIANQIKDYMKQKKLERYT